jgi:hypothetical protein
VGRLVAAVARNRLRRRLGRTAPRERNLQLRQALIAPLDEIGGRCQAKAETAQPVHVGGIQLQHEKPALVVGFQQLRVEADGGLARHLRAGVVGAVDVGLELLLLERVVGLLLRALRPRDWAGPRARKACHRPLGEPSESRHLTTS